MNESTRKRAERAALAQRFQLDALQRALQSLEGELSVLESETAIQTDELSLLDELVAQLHSEAGLARATEPARPAAHSLAEDDVPDRRRPYFRNVERYIADHGIEEAPDPLAQLLPPHRAAEIAGTTASSRWRSWSARSPTTCSSPHPEANSRESPSAKARSRHG